jgi:D-alanyl-D-alanine dipeptidase
MIFPHFLFNLTIRNYNIMKTLSILTLTLTFFTACHSNPSSTSTQVIAKENLLQLKNPNIIFPTHSSQLLFVTTKDWNTKEGKLQRYERGTSNDDTQWVKVGKSIDIILGRNGLGWGKGLHTIPKNAQYIKKEGDGKSPAGLFSLGHGFGYNNFSIDFPYTTYKRTDHCVDDSKSQWYNQIIDSTKVKKDYKSFEHMKLKNHLYKYGITVNHNPDQITNAGSCIFMHIRSENGKGTAGCTAMKEKEIITILKWLKQEQQPLLLQLPKKEISNITF